MHVESPQTSEQSSCHADWLESLRQLASVLCWYASLPQLDALHCSRFKNFIEHQSDVTKRRRALQHHAVYERSMLKAIEALTQPAQTRAAHYPFASFEECLRTLFLGSADTKQLPSAQAAQARAQALCYHAWDLGQWQPVQVWL